MCCGLLIQCSLPNTAACPRFADQAGALPCRHSFMAVRFFVVLLPVRDLLLVAKHLFVATRTRQPSTNNRAGDGVAANRSRAIAQRAAALLAPRGHSSRPILPPFEPSHSAASPHGGLKQMFGTE
jgi:hypothetical protein